MYATTYGLDVASILATVRTASGSMYGRPHRPHTIFTADFILGLLGHVQCVDIQSLQGRRLQNQCTRRAMVMRGHRARYADLLAAALSAPLDVSPSSPPPPCPPWLIVEAPAVGGSLSASEELRVHASQAGQPLSAAMSSTASDRVARRLGQNAVICVEGHGAA